MSENYWATHSVEEHEQKIRELNKRFITGKLSCSDVQKEIAHLFGEDNPEFEQQQQLEAQINERISAKMRGNLSAEQYFAIRERIRNKILDAPQEEAKKIAEEEARQEGTCLSCGAKCRSKGQEWYCPNPKCHHRQRKH